MGQVAFGEVLLDSSDLAAALDEITRSDRVRVKYVDVVRRLSRGLSDADKQVLTSVQAATLAKIMRATAVRISGG